MQLDLPPAAMQLDATDLQYLDLMWLWSVDALGWTIHLVLVDLSSWI
jgi:hypothetical protein